MRNRVGVTSGIDIRPIALGDIAGFRECVGDVMRERRFLAYLEAFPLDRTAAFVATNIVEGNPHLVAADGDAIVGWCDVRRETIPVYAHCAMLGMGVRAEYRGGGIGERLIRTALAAAKAVGIERVELSVYAQNAAAQALYGKVGFVAEGTRRRGKKLDGAYDDVHMMVYFC